MPGVDQGPWFQGRVGRVEGAAGPSASVPKTKFRNLCVIFISKSNGGMEGRGGVRGGAKKGKGSGGVQGLRFWVVGGVIFVPSLQGIRGGQRGGKGSGQGPRASVSRGVGGRGTGDG